MSVLDRSCLENPDLKIVCETCGGLSIKLIDPAGAPDGANVHCGHCDAIRGTVAGLRNLARRATGEFEI